jgi:hypothetical protein
MSTFSTAEVREALELVHDLAGPGTFDAKVARVVEGLRVLVPHTTATVWFFDPLDKKNTVPLFSTIDASTARAYAEHYITLDPMTRNHRAADFGPHRYCDVVSDRELEESEFYCDLLAKSDTRYVFGIQVRLPSERVLAIGLQRPRSMGEFGEKERDAARLLRPYLETYFYEAALPAGDPGALRFVVASGGRVVPIAAEDGHYRGPPAPPFPDFARDLPDLARKLPPEALAVALRILDVGPAPGARAHVQRLADGAIARFRFVPGALDPMVEVTIHGPERAGAPARARA